LCYLSEGGAELRELEFSAEELEQWRLRVRRAGREIASLPPLASPLDLPPGEGCLAKGCSLGLAGLCPGC
jgi:hypothetical protein